MRILFVLPEYPPHHGGGLLAYYRQLAPVLAKRGHEMIVRVAAPFDDAYPDYEEAGVQVRFLTAKAMAASAERFNRYRVTPHLRRFLGAAWAAYEAESQGDGFDIVETTDWGLLFAPWAVASTPRPPLCVTLHGSSGQIDTWDKVAGQVLQGTLLRLIEQAGLRSVGDLHTYGSANEAFWEELTSRQVRYHPPAWAGPRPSGQKADGPPFVAGRIQSWKGPDTLCEACRLLRGKGPTRILWAGRSVAYRGFASYEEKLRREFADVWGSVVVPLGQRTAADTAAYQTRAAFVIVPSKWDVFNFTCAEAMAKEKVVVCSTGAGASDLIDDGVNGFLFRAEDPESLAGAIERVWALTESDKAEIGERARETVLQRLDPGNVAAFKESTYSDLVRDSAGAARPVSPWFAEAVVPGWPSADRDLDVLDVFPFRPLLSATMRRALRRITG